MTDRRIRVSEEKTVFIKTLIAGAENKGIFDLQADVLAFAASLGFHRGRFKPLAEVAKDPIRQDVFYNQGYDKLINLLAISHERDPLVLQNIDDMEDKRIGIFEGYANGGLQILEEELLGATGNLDTILLLLSKQRGGKEKKIEDIDLSQFVD